MDDQHQPITVNTDQQGLATAADVAGAESALAHAESIEITAPEDADEAAAFLKQCTEAGQALEARRKDITRPLDEAKKSVMDLFRGPAGLIERARTTVKGKIGSYHAEQQRIADEQRRKAEEKARRDAEKAAEKAKQYQEEGRDDKAAEWEQRRQDAETAPAPTAAPPKPKGVAMRTSWKVEVVDLKALLAAVAAGKVPISCVKVQQGPLNKHAAAFEGEVEIPGCKVHKHTTVAG